METFACISLLLGLGSRPSGICLPCWELMLSAGSQETSEDIGTRLQHLYYAPTPWPCELRSCWGTCGFAACTAQELECMAAVQQKSKPKGELPGLTGGDKRCSTELEEEPAFSSLYKSSPSFPSSSRYANCLSLSCPLLPFTNIFWYLCLIPCLRGDSLSMTILFHLLHQEMRMANLTQSWVF